MSKSPTDDLISNLMDDLEPVKTLQHPFKRGVLLVFSTLVYVAIVAYFLNFRPDLEGALSDKLFLFDVILMSAVFLSAAFAASWLCVPDLRGQSWIIAVPLTLFAVFVTWAGLEALTSDMVIPHIHLHHCVLDAGLIVSIPTALAVFFTMRGATTRPVLSAFMSMLSVGALGYVSLSFTCMSDALGHIAVYHIMPFLIGGGIIGAVAQRFYRW